MFQRPRPPYLRIHQLRLGPEQTNTHRETRKKNLQDLSLEITNLHMETHPVTLPF